LTTALATEQQDFLESVRNFCERENDLSFRETTERMAELHWWGLMIDEEYGGSGGTFVDASLFLEEISHGLSPAAGAYGVTLIVVGALNSFGTEEQKQELLGGVARSGNCLAIAMSEPEAGSDVGALKTRAVRENGEYVLNGSKMWISYAREASHVLIVCRTQEGSTKHEG
jgi:alkylation response protein AidB-like acyl-CoA dehydrogenase